MTLRLSVRSKVLLSGVVIVLLICLFNAVYYPQRQKRAAMEGMRERARNTAGMLALSTGIGLELNHLEAVTAAFAWARSDSSLVYIVVMDSAGTVFASYNPQHIPVAAPRALGTAVAREDADRLVAVAPIRVQRRDYGTLVLGLSLDGLHAQIARDRLTALVVSIATLAVGAALSLVFAGRIAAPIVLLRRAADQISHGQYDVTIPRGGGDEVGALSAAFSTMADTVRASIARLAAQTDDLREREQRLAEAQAIAHVGSWEWDIATGAVTWSDEQCRLFGIPVGSPASYEGFVARVHPDDRDRVQGIIAQGLAGRRTEEYEWRLVRSDGTIRHMQTVSVVVTDAAAKPVRMAGTSVDITDRKTAEENQTTLLRGLQTALAEVKTLRGLIKICANCKRVLTDRGGWEQFESYVRGHSDVEFSHGICPDCARKWAADGG
jgi:PAS domain S-box-containing protein